MLMWKYRCRFDIVFINDKWELLTISIYCVLQDENHLVYNALTLLLYLKWDCDIKIFCFDNFIHELRCMWYDVYDYHRTNALLIMFKIQYLYLYFLLYFLSSLLFNSVLYYLNSVSLNLYVNSNLYFSTLLKKENVRAFKSFY